MDAAARSVSSIVNPRPDKANATPAKAVQVHAPVEFRLITERSDFDAIEAEWNELFSRAGRPTQVFQSFNFCWHWANHYLSPTRGRGLRLSIVTARRRGRLLLVWPLVSERVRGINQTFWMGEPVAQYGDVLIDAEPDAEAIVQLGYAFLRGNAASDMLRLRHVRADAAVQPLLSAVGAEVVDRQIAPYMDLTTAPDFAAFEHRYSSKERKNRRRLARRLEEKGCMEFVRLHGGEEARSLAHEAVALKVAWLRNRGLVSSALHDPRLPGLFADLAANAEKPVGCVVSALKSNGEVAAVEVSFAAKRRLAMHLIAFNLVYEKSGAGVLLLEESLRQGYAEHFDIYDMLAPGDVYKFDWCDKSDPVFDWVMPLSLKGHLYAKLYLELLRGRAKTMLKGLPQPLRRMIRDGFSRKPRASTSGA